MAYHRILSIVPELCYTVGPGCLSIMYIHNNLHLLIQTPSLSLPQLPFPWQSQVFSLCL